jgi:hypothetical protein
MMMMVMVMITLAEARMGVRGTVRKASSRTARPRSGQGRVARLATQEMVRAEIVANPLGHAGVPYWYMQCNTTLSHCRERTGPVFMAISISSKKTCMVDTSAVGFVTEWCKPPKRNEAPWWFPIVGIPLFVKMVYLIPSPGLRA